MRKKIKINKAEGNRKKEKMAARRNSVTVKANLSLCLITLPCAFLAHGRVKIQHHAFLTSAEWSV
jgi:hypothetical protein